MKEPIAKIIETTVDIIPIAEAQSLSQKPKIIERNTNVAPNIVNIQKHFFKSIFLPALFMYSNAIQLVPTLGEMSMLLIYVQSL